MSEYYLDEELPTFCNPETYEAFRQFAEKWRSSTFEELQFQLESLQNENNRLKTQIKAMNMRTLNVTSATMKGKFILNPRPGKNLRSFALVLAK